MAAKLDKLIVVKDIFRGKDLAIKVGDGGAEGDKGVVVALEPEAAADD